MTRALRASLFVLVPLLVACPPDREGEPPLVEICGDGIDNDEDGRTDEPEDLDGDGFFTCIDGHADCADGDAALHPGAAEACDEVDNDCDGDIDEDCEDDVLDAYPVDMEPSSGEDSFLPSATLWLEFDRPVQSVGLSLTDAAGAPVAGSISNDIPWRVFFFDPLEDLEPDSSYQLRVAWSPASDSPVDISFSTSAHGQQVEDPQGLIGRTFFADVAEGTWIDPPGVGPIIGSQFDGVAVLLTMTDDSDLGAGEVHVMGAVGTDEFGQQEQDPCAETFWLTAGPDGVVGTADDQPGSWNNPVVETGPADVELFFGAAPVWMKDVVTSGTFAPDGMDQQGGVLEAVIDTRPMAAELDPDGGPGAVCDLIWETVNVPCEECGEPDPGTFCLQTRAEDVLSTPVAGLQLQEIGCADVIGQFEGSGACEAEAAGYDADGDGDYELCPEW